MQVVGFSILFYLCLAFSTTANKAWNTRFALKTQETQNFSHLDTLVESLCRDRSLLAADALSGASQFEVRHVLIALVDKTDQQRFLETLPLINSLNDNTHNVQETDLVMILMGMIKGLKKVKRSIEQGRQLIESSVDILNLSDEYVVLLVLALNITILLNASGDTEKASKDLLTLHDFSRDFLAKRSVQYPTELIGRFRRGMLRYGPFDNLLRVKSSLLQRSREQVTYSSKLNGLGLLDGIVRDRRVEILVVLALERAVSQPSIDAETLLQGCQYAASSGSSGDLYRQGRALLDCMQQQGEETTVCWSHRHFQEARALLLGHRQGQQAVRLYPQLEGTTWEACKGPLVDKAVRGVDATMTEADFPGDINLMEVLTTPNSRVLVVGDGDLSFSRALLKMSEGLPPGTDFRVDGSVLETREEIIGRYTGGADNVEALCGSQRGAAHFQVDCTQLPSCLPCASSYDAYIFNFPFADATPCHRQPFSTRHVAVSRHQGLLRSFLSSVRDLHEKNDEDEGKDVTVLISLLVHQAIAWDIEQVGLDEGFALTRVFPFNERLYRSLGYRRKRSYSDDTFRQLAPGYATNVVEGWTFVLAMQKRESGCKEEVRWGLK